MADEEMMDYAALDSSELWVNVVTVLAALAGLTAAVVLQYEGLIRRQFRQRLATVEADSSLALSIGLVPTNSDSGDDSRGSKGGASGADLRQMRITEAAACTCVAAALATCSAAGVRVFNSRRCPMYAMQPWVYPADGPKTCLEAPSGL
jgi:hypothetical protein